VETSKQEVTVAEPSKWSSILQERRRAGLKGEDLDMLSDDPTICIGPAAVGGTRAGPNGGQILYRRFQRRTASPKESIREIRSIRIRFPPNSTLRGTAGIEIFTRPGTDKFHGTVNLIIRMPIFKMRASLFARAE